jgi:ribosomal-protein-alanine N-acetyltransferase
MMKEMASAFPSIKVRNCLSSDLIRIEEIETISFDDPYPLSLFQKLLAEYPWGFRVATDGDLAIGYCVLVQTSDGSSLLIASIAVDPLYKRRGIGTRMIEDAISIGRSRNRGQIRRIMLQVRESNEGAISLYRKIGFRNSSIIQDYYGVGKDALEMSLDV